MMPTMRTTMTECEFFVRSWRKPDHVLIERCALTGKTCFCAHVYLTCTRRTLALKWEVRHQCHVGSRVRVVCAGDDL